MIKWEFNCDLRLSLSNRYVGQKNGCWYRKSHLHDNFNDFVMTSFQNRVVSRRDIKAAWKQGGLRSRPNFADGKLVSKENSLGNFDFEERFIYFRGP